MLSKLWPRGKLAREETLWYYVFISPWVIGFLVFVLGPLLASFLLSFTNYSFIETPKLVGLGNYQRLFSDDLFWTSLRVTTKYTMLSVPLSLFFSLLLAIVLNQRVPLLSIFRTLYYLPSVIGGVPVAILFQWILNPQFGIVNYVIAVFLGPEGLIPLGIVGPRWFLDPNWAIPSVVLLGLWGFGAPMLIYLAALQGVPTALYEAATIDGANILQRFRYVTLPMISPAILFLFITEVIGSFQVFTQVFIISNARGGPSYSTYVYVLNLFLTAFVDLRMGLGAAMGWILFIIILGLTILLFRFSREFVYYEAPGGG